MYIKRTLVLTGEDKKSILSLEKSNNPKAVLKNGQGDYAVFKFNDAPIELYPLIEVDDALQCDLPKYVDLSGDIACAVLNFDTMASILYIGATTDKEYFRIEVTKNIDHFTTQIQALKGESINENVAEQIEPLFQQSEDDVETGITDALLTECLNMDSRCEGCIYKQAFFEREQDEKEENLNQETENVKNEFFEQVKSSIDNLFETYPPNDELIEAIENSRFVKVDYEGDGNFYSVGLIFDDDDLKYICYAIPSEEGVCPPKELSEFSQWLKIRDGYGYWLTYQDGKTGESITFV